MTTGTPSGPSIGIAEFAAELGRSSDWLYSHWRELVRKRDLPPPVQTSRSGTGTIVWSRAQVYAWLDRDVPAHLRSAVAAYRAAFAAADGARFSGGDEAAIADHQARLERKYMGETA